MLNAMNQFVVLGLIEKFARGERVLPMRKGVTTGTISPIVPQDLELESHNTLWNESKPTQLTLLKLMPSVPAKQIAHEYSRIIGFGERRTSGFFGERSLPQNSSISTDRVVNNIRLMGEIGSTFLLAEMEKTQKVMGTTGASNIERKGLRLSVLEKKNRNLYGSDTSTIRQGVSGVRYKGVEQLVREGTDGTTGTSPFGSHVIDMKGLPLTVTNMRNRVADAISQFGFPTILLMDGNSRADLEASLDPAARLPYPPEMRPYLVGQTVGGFQTQGGIVKFHTDNGLHPMWYKGQYIATIPEGGPMTIPAVSASAGAVGVGRTSNWDSASAGNVYYVVTETVDELEGLGTRYPAVPGNYLAVAAGQEVTILVTPGNPLADSFKIYRGSDADGAKDPTGAWFIFEAANSGGGAQISIFDDNNERPNTGRAFMLNIVSASQDALGRDYYSAKEKSSEFFQMEDDPTQNTVACAELGPSMGILALASLLAEIDRPLMYSAHAPEVRNALQNFIFKNIGRAPTT